MSDALWVPAPVPEAAAELVRAGVSEHLAALLARRGVETPSQVEGFFSPALDQLHDPFELAGVTAAVERLHRAREAGERVAIVGDYDVDGVSGTALLLAVLRYCGFDAEPILPHRMREGYGFQPVHAERAAAAGCALVVTVDCGTTSVAAADRALELGLGVIVTDHHLPGPELPAGVIQVNPRQAGCSYPFPDLSGAGIALKLAQALGRRLEREPDPTSLLRMACLGTVADMVPLLGENRAIAALGLAALPSTPSAGLQALMRQAGVKAPLSASDIGFRIGPRINAAGRLDDARRALDLLLSRDPAAAGRLAADLDRWNRERQEEEARVVGEAREQVLARAAAPTTAPTATPSPRSWSPGARTGTAEWWASPPAGWCASSTGRRSCWRWRTAKRSAPAGAFPGSSSTASSAGGASRWRGSAVTPRRSACRSRSIGSSPCARTGRPPPWSGPRTSSGPASSTSSSWRRPPCAPSSWRSSPGSSPTARATRSRCSGSDPWRSPASPGSSAGAPASTSPRRSPGRTAARWRCWAGGGESASTSSPAPSRRSATSRQTATPDAPFSGWSTRVTRTADNRAMARSREARKNRRIQALRLLLLVALVATVGGLVAFLVRSHLEREAPPVPEPVGPEAMEAGGETVTVGEGFERTMSEGDRALFTVRGDRYSVTRANVVHLEGVAITVYDDAGRPYEIASPEAWFQPDKREARLVGGVEITGPNGMRAVTEALFVRNQGHLITSKKGQIYIRFGDRFHARADQLRVELANQRFRLLGHARVLSLEESPVPFEMNTRLLTIDRSRHLLEGEGGPVEITHRQDWLQAEKVTAFLDDDEKRVQFIRAEGRVVAELRSDEALGRTIEPLAVPDAMTGARTPEASPTAASDVRGDRAAGRGAADGRRKATRRPSGRRRGSVASWSTPSTSSSSSTRTAARRGRSTSRVGPTDWPPCAPSSSTGGRSTACAPRTSTAPSPRAGRRSSWPARTSSCSRSTAQPMSIAEEIQDELSESAPAGELDEAGPEGEQTRPAPERRISRRATARTAEATFDAGGELASVVLSDRVRMVDRGTGEARPTLAHGDRGVFDLAEDSLTLTGIPAQIDSARGVMEAPTLTYTRADGILHGTGGVRARLEQAATSALGGTPLAQGDGPVWVEADQGFLRDQPRSFLFSGSVRAWRGSDLLTADQLRGDDAEQRLHAAGSVRTLWTPDDRAQSDGEETADGPLEVTSDEMEFRQDQRLLVYTGDVVSKQQEPDRPLPGDGALPDARRSGAGGSPGGG